MKKTICGILAAVILVVSVFSINAFAAETKTDTLFDTIKNSKELSLTFTAGDTILGSSTDTVHVKGNDIAYEYNTGFLKVMVVLKDGTAYAYLPMLPFFYVKLANTGIIKIDVWQIINTAFGITQGVLNYVGSSTETVDGKDYYVEEFNDRAQVTSKFYYEGDTLKMLSVKDARTGSTQNTLFDSYSFTVSDSVFATPSGVDLSIIFSWLFAALIGA